MTDERARRGTRHLTTKRMKWWTGAPGEGGATKATVFGVCAVFLLAAALQADGPNEGAAEFTSESTDLLGVAAANDGGGHCVPNDTTLCLLKEKGAEEGRYAVTIALGAPEHFEAVRDGAAPGPEEWETCDKPPVTRDPEFPCHTKVVKGGSRVIGTDDSGLFYFYNRNNWEVLIKVLNGCGIPALPNHWVYAASASDQGMQITVRDTAWTDAAEGTGRVRERVYTFAPHKRRPQAPGESDEDYERNVLAKGHPALTASTASDAFPHVCPAPAAASEVADTGAEVDPEGNSPGSS